jgi:NAD(P)-dependent dehydrogenase (short-subunit alcohol dehydrogenase family)
MDKPTVTFFGIGLMGEPMAERMLQAGFTVHAWNRTAAKAQAVDAADAIVHPAPPGRAGLGRRRRRPKRHACHHGWRREDRFRP